MKKLVSQVAVAGLFAFSTLAAPAAFAEEGKTSAGGTSSANSGSSGDKTDKNMQENGMSNDKSKQSK